MTEPVPAQRAKPGEYFLAAETVEAGLRFQYRDAVYEVVEVLAPIGTGVVVATIRMVEGRLTADDGTEWVFSPGLNLWTGWMPGEDGVWTMTPDEFAKAYPELATVYRAMLHTGRRMDT